MDQKAHGVDYFQSHFLCSIFQSDSPGKSPTKRKAANEIAISSTTAATTTVTATISTNADKVLCKMQMTWKWKRPKHLLPNVQIDRDGERKREGEKGWLNVAAMAAKIYQTPLEAPDKYATYLQQIIIMCQQIYICTRGDCLCVCVWVCLLVCHLPFGIFRLPASLVSAVYGYQWTLNCSHEICNCNCAHA